MIGLLFHGPEVFDSGWAQKMIEFVESFDTPRCVLAGTMGRTAVFDSGLDGIEFKDQMPGACLRELSRVSELVMIVNFGKSVASGLVFGGMVVERSGIRTDGIKSPMVQVECSGPVWVEWADGTPSAIKDGLCAMGVPVKEKIAIAPNVWETNGRVYRRMTTAQAGDFVLVDGIMVGRATGVEVVLACENGHICDVRGVDVKDHGIEKLDRLGGVDLQAAKLASTPRLRRTGFTRRNENSNGRGMVFVDHTGMHVYELARDVQGVVTVGDDTTVVAADILSRFNIPVIGIVDGDEDVILENGQFAPGSVRLTVKKDDEFGLRVFDAVFNGNKHIDMEFDQVLDKIMILCGSQLIATQYF